MILAIDIGNTSLEMGCVDNDEILFHERIGTDLRKTELEYTIAFKGILNFFSVNLNAIEGVIMSSVVPSLTNTIETAIEKLTGKKAMIVGPGVKTGLNILLDNPTDMGADLVANAVAGIAEYGFPLIIVDMGTATTIEVVDRKGNYIGGAVMPGFNSSFYSLIRSAARLPNIEPEAPGKTIGKNTIDCMKSGIVYGNASMVDGMIDRIEKELGYGVKIVATGGMAKTLVSVCKHDILLDQELLMKGLNIIYKKNTEKKA